MLKTGRLLIRVDPTIKAAAETLYARLGLNLSQAINIFLCQSIAQGGLPFELMLEKAQAQDN
ncbi:MAG: type II toxin-antitoxin system RelB/DinJ family antitoxin [Acidaminococcaceae bacterium]